MSNYPHIFDFVPTTSYNETIFIVSGSLDFDWKA